MTEAVIQTFKYFVTESFNKTQSCAMCIYYDSFLYFSSACSQFLYISLTESCFSSDTIQTVTAGARAEGETLEELG